MKKRYRVALVGYDELPSQSQQKRRRSLRLPPVLAGLSWQLKAACCCFGLGTALFVRLVLLGLGA